MMEPLKRGLSTATAFLIAGVAAVIALAAVLVLVALLFGAFSGSSKSDPFTPVVQAMRSAGSAKIVLRESRFGHGTVARREGVGVLSFRSGAARLRYTNGERILVRRPYVYVAGPGVPAGKWCKYDVSDVGAGFFFGPMTGYGSDPSVALVNLERSNDYSAVDDEQRFGDLVTRYVGKLDLRTVEVTSSPLQHRLALVSRLNRRGIALTVWASWGIPHLLRRIRATFMLAGGKRFVGTYDLSNYGISARGTATPPVSERIGGSAALCRLPPAA